ncbi:hypothetical protein GCM10010254_10090 [Streptomyces chromofuscus]|nr:hypothetical protein GCM10010254_10090 [Streptomyces chromofuscus]
MREQGEDAESGSVAHRAGRDGAGPGEADSAVAVHREEYGYDDEGELDATAPGETDRGSGCVHCHGGSGSGIRHVRYLPK